MSAQDQARALMSRHHHQIKQRQQSLLGRTAAEIGIDADVHYWNHIQGKPHPTFARNYDRSGATMS